MLPVLSFLCLFSAVFLVAEVVSIGARQRSLAVRRATNYARPRVASGQERMRFRQRVLLPAAARLARIALRLNPRVTIEGVQRKLLAAGLSRRISPTTFLATKAGFAIGFGFLG